MCFTGRGECFEGLIRAESEDIGSAAFEVFFENFPVFCSAIESKFPIRAELSVDLDCI